MTFEQLDKWANNLGNAWVNLDPDKAMENVNSRHIEWYENPLDEPIKSWDEVYEL